MAATAKFVWHFSNKFVFMAEKLEPDITVIKT
jgi:hypothetical protein